MNFFIRINGFFLKQTFHIKLWIKILEYWNILMMENVIPPKVNVNDTDKKTSTTRWVDTWNLSPWKSLNLSFWGDWVIEPSIRKLDEEVFRKFLSTTCEPFWDLIYFLCNNLQNITAFKIHLQWVKANKKVIVYHFANQCEQHITILTNLSQSYITFTFAFTHYTSKFIFHYSLEKGEKGFWYKIFSPE